MRTARPNWWAANWWSASHRWTVRGDTRRRAATSGMVRNSGSTGDAGGEVAGPGPGGTEGRRCMRAAPAMGCRLSYKGMILNAKAKIDTLKAAEFLHGPATRAPAGSTNPTALEALARKLAGKRARTRRTGRCHAVSPDRRS